MANFEEHIAGLVEDVAKALERIAEADEKRNQLLQEDRAERREWTARNDAETAKVVASIETTGRELVLERTLREVVKGLTDRSITTAEFAEVLDRAENVLAGVTPPPAESPMS